MAVVCISIDESETSLR